MIVSRIQIVYRQIYIVALVKVSRHSLRPQACSYKCTYCKKNKPWLDGIERFKVRYRPIQQTKA